jgi:hypothetical protein
VRKIHRFAWLLVCLSALLQVLIFPLPNLYVLSWIALAPLLVALLHARVPETLQLEELQRLIPATPWQGFLLGYVCGILWYLGTCYWVYDTMHQYGGLAAPLAAFVLLLFSLYLGLYHGAFGLLLALLARRHSYRLALISAPFLWVALELARTRISGFPWELLGHGLYQQPLLLLESFVKLRTRQGDENTDHGCNNSALLDKPDLRVKNRDRVIVKTDNKSALHLKTGLLDLPDARKEITVLVMKFAAFCKALFMRRLDADENNIEACLYHQLKKVFMIGQLYGRLSIKGEWILFLLHPFNNPREDILPQLFLISDKIVVNKEDLSPEAIRVQTIEFPEDLFFILCSRDATAKQGDVAKLAVEGTAPGILDIDRGIMVHIDETPQRNRCLPYICPLIGSI